jgi:hypothetical protein
VPGRHSSIDKSGRAQIRTGSLRPRNGCSPRAAEALPPQQLEIRLIMHRQDLGRAHKKDNHSTQRTQ